MTQDSPSKTICFPLAELDLGVADAIPKMPAHARWPAFNAIRHLNRAWQLRQLDPQMAYFRSITAEEEAATALFLSLKQRNYNGAEKLKHRDHLHKNALFPFIGAVSRVFAKVHDVLPPTTIILDNNSLPPRMLIQIEIRPNGTDKSVYALPDGPLNFLASGSLQGSPSKRLDFSNEIAELTAERNVKTILEHLKTRANLRNRLLYASKDGCPDIKGDIEPLLKDFQTNVFLILKLYMMIDPYNSQLFVQQCLDAFLRMLGKLPNDET